MKLEKLMVRSKLNKKKLMKNVEPEPADSGIPIPDLPEKFLLMEVKSGSKIRNVLDYALKEFSNYNNIIWNAAGKAVGKAISCAQIFKTKEKNLHQITKIRFIESKESEKRKKDESTENVEIYYVPEIFIFLAKEVKDTSVLGYQAPDDDGEFLNGQEKKNECKDKKQEAGSNVTRVDAEQFAAMGLKAGQKRPKKEQTKGQTEAPPKRSRERANDGR